MKDAIKALIIKIGTICVDLETATDSYTDITICHEGVFEDAMLICYSNENGNDLYALIPYSQIRWISQKEVSPE